MQNLSQLTGLAGTGTFVNVTVSRSTPTVTDDLLIVGIYGPAFVIAVTRSRGSLVWSTQLEQSPLRLITVSGTVYQGAYYVGVSSFEISLLASQCCTFRGSLAKLDVRTGRIQWRTYTLPDNGGRLGGYAGAGIWESSPSIDIHRRHVYVGTGNLYTAPKEVLECQERQNNQSNSSQPIQCFGSDVHFDSMLAFDINTGRIVWSRQLGGYDVFVIACVKPNNPDCPPGPNLDADFGEAPMLLTIYPNGTRIRRDVVVAVQKSGFAWALDRDNGSIVWYKGTLGGGTWGAATDEKLVYTNIANSNNKPLRLAPSNQITTAGGWVGLDANSGQIIWTTANPSNTTANGPVSLTNGVLFAGSVAPNGPIYAMDGDTGRVLWSYNTGAAVYGGISVSYGCIFVGNGYAAVGAIYNQTWTAGTSLYAFCLP